MSTSTATFTSRADVSTDHPGRYAKQLVSHLGRKLDFVIEGAVSTARIGTGTGQLVVGDGLLTLHASGRDEASLAAIQDVLARHLLRFATREELTVVWARPAAQAPPP